MSIRLRPHHILCSIGFDGHGYNDAFTANMTNVVKGELRAPGGRDVTVRISAEADTYCAACPHRRGLGCVYQEKIDGLDSRHGAALGIAPDEVLTWGACLDRVVERIEPRDLDVICAGCQWLDYGLCKDAVAKLRSQRATPPRKERRIR